MSSAKNQWKNQHLAWRAGFGPQVEMLPQLLSGKPDGYLKALLKASEKSPDYLNVVSNSFDGLMMGMKNLSQEEKRKIQQQSREDIKSLNLRWLDEMINSPAQLREKMSFFWHGHFACRNLNIFYQQLLLHTIRINALGDFKTLLLAVSKSAAMINFLNNNQNRKGHPNENFARELMELFTMGLGNYTEQDVKEAARAFTGWGANVAGEFQFRAAQHDNGSKTFQGKTGNLSGEDIIDIVLEQLATARFITAKFLRFFVNEQVPEDKLYFFADRFRQSGYQIAGLMKDVYSSDWFYEPANIGNRIKSPVELWVGLRRQLPFTLPDPSVQLQVQKLLGQILFYPPNVAGWPNGKSWIDGSSLLFRMRLPQLLTGSEALQIKAKDDDDLQMGRTIQAANGRNFRADIHWDQYMKPFLDMQKEKRVAMISNFLLQTGAKPSSALLLSHADNSSSELQTGTVSLTLMSMPEYQLN